MSGAVADHFGSLASALENARRLVGANPSLAQEQALEILKVAPEHPGGHLTLGLSRARMGRHEEAAHALQRALELDPRSSLAWRTLGDQLTILEDAAGADTAYAESIRTSVSDPQLQTAARALSEGKLAIAEHVLRPHLQQKPTDVAAIRMLAEVAARLGRYEEAEALLARALDLSPSFLAARHNYAIVLHRQSKGAEALAQIDMLLAADPGNPSYCFLRASALTRIGQYDAAIAIYEDIFGKFPANPRGWMSLGHARKTAGRQAESIEAYTKSLELAPHFGEAYWSLANMKTYRFSEEMKAAMEAQLAREDLGPEDRFHLHYALGKACEDAGDYARSFEHYQDGARLRRAGLNYDAEVTSRMTREHIALYTKEFLAARAGQGAPAPDPIFIVGLPRSGSTLIEQILASHGDVEGTMELPDLLMLAKRIGGGKVRGARYPSALADMSASDLRALGEEYIARTRVQRKTDRPYFIDKLPNNFQHIGLIRLVLPNAKIIDARRGPMGCCFSAYKQHFARGQAFSYDFSDLGRYYSDYMELMAHFDKVAPGRVCRVLYENMIADSESEIRRLLDYCGLQFDPACLNFHANTRAVRTASSEQVRLPIYTDAVDQWRNFEPWLGPLKRALGPVLDDYPNT